MTVRDYSAGDALALDEFLASQAGACRAILEPCASRDTVELRLLIYDDGTIKGCARLEIDPRVSQMALFTAPAYRRQGIGGKLWQAGVQILQAADPQLIQVVTLEDEVSAHDFFARRGCQHDYSHHHMRFAGSPFPPTRLDVRLYHDIYFESYFSAYQHAFRPWMDQLGIPLLEEDWRMETRQYAGAQKENLYLFFASGILVASAMLVDGFKLERVFVHPDFQGQGYGRQVVEYMVNRVLQRKRVPELSVLTTNNVAIHLYQQLGFYCVNTLSYCRIYRKANP